MRAVISPASTRLAAVSSGLASALSTVASGRNWKPLNAPDELALDQDLTIRLDRGKQLIAGAQAAHQDGRPAVDEALGEPRVQGIRQRVLDRPGPPLPVIAVGQPVAPVRDVGPGPDEGDARHQGVDVAVAAVEAVRSDAPPSPRAGAPRRS